ncbi:MAG: hypothetical protein AB1553_08880 [Nitrospirota bacterium]
MSEAEKKEEGRTVERTIDFGDKRYIIRRTDALTTVIRTDTTTGDEQVISRCWGLGDMDNYEFEPATETLRSKLRFKNK